MSGPPRSVAWGLMALALLIPAIGCKRSSTASGEPESRRGAHSGPTSTGDAAATAARGSQPAGAPKLCVHEVPADQCTKCNPDLVAAFKDLDDWCGEHGLPESHCRLCNPQLTFAKAPALKDWCKEHALPESKCTKCNPSLIPKYIAANDFCREHGLPASACPHCHPELPAAVGQPKPVAVADGTKVKLASGDTERDVGIRTVRVDRRPLASELEVVGRLAFNRNRHAQLSARSEALVVEVKVDVGDDVRAGQALVTLASASVGENRAHLASAKARVEAARLALERERRLSARGISPRKSAEEAERDLAEAEAEQNAAKASLTATGAQGGSASGQYLLVAPFAGTVVARDAAIGKSASTGQVLIEVADLSTIWAELDVPEAEVAVVRPGQEVTLSFEGARLAPIQAKIARLGSSVDASSRTVSARVQLDNKERVFKSETFVRGKIQVSGVRDAIVLPKGAVQEVAGTSLVFVKKGEGIYEPVPVTTGSSSTDGVEITSGLAPGVDVVTTGAFLLKTEVLKDSIGAGCCEGGE